MSEGNGKNPEGTAWLDDVELREIGLAQTIRRKPQTLPVTVTSADGSIRYAEWQDDQRTPADYIVGVESLTIPATSMIREGQVLRVSSYQSGENMTSRWSTPASAACASDCEQVMRSKPCGVSMPSGDATAMAPATSSICRQRARPVKAATR